MNTVLYRIHIVCYLTWYAIKRRAQARTATATPPPLALAALPLSLAAGLLSPHLAHTER